MYQIYKWGYLYEYIYSLSWINCGPLHHPKFSSSTTAFDLEDHTSPHNLFPSMWMKGSNAHIRPGCDHFYQSPNHRQKSAYMIESEANTCACEQGVVLKRKRPNLSMDRRAWWGVLSHFWEASGSWWSGTTTRQISFCFLLPCFKERMHWDCDCHCAFVWDWEKER